MRVSLRLQKYIISNPLEFANGCNYDLKIPYEYFLEVDPEQVADNNYSSIDFLNVLSYVENIYNIKNGYSLLHPISIKLQSKTNLGYFDVHLKTVSRPLGYPGSSLVNDKHSASYWYKETWVNLFHIRDYKEDQKHCEYYLAYVIAHEYLHQLSAKYTHMLFWPFSTQSKSWGQFINDNIFLTNYHINNEPNLLISGADIPNHHNGEHIPKYYSLTKSKFENIDDRISTLHAIAILNYHMYFGLNPFENIFYEQLLGPDINWYKKSFKK